MILKNNNFEDIVLHAQALDFWKQEYNQLSEAPFQSCLQDLHVDGFRIFREKMNCRVAQSTRTPKDTLNILIPIQLSTEQQYQAHTLASEGATLLPSDQDFFFCTPPDTDYIVLSLHQDFLAEKLIHHDLDKIRHKRFGCSIGLNQQISKALVQHSCQLLEHIHSNPKIEMLNLMDEITALLLHYFQSSEDSAQTKELGSNHHHILNYMYERILEDQSLSILDICKELGIPHRSLHYALQKTVGMSPNKFIRAIKLNAADRIIHDSKSQLKLTDIALDYGFSHSSHFGREYKKLFGKTPAHAYLH